MTAADRGVLPLHPMQLRQEQARIVAKHGSEFGRAAMAEMRYADACAREVLRIWGTAEMLFRCVVLHLPLFSCKSLSPFKSTCMQRRCMICLLLLQSQAGHYAQ